MPPRVSRPIAFLVFGTVAALVAGVFLACVAPNLTEWGPGARATNDSYNQLVAGFRDGHLSLQRDVPEGLARLADPYDPAANLQYQLPPFGLHDLSYYQGRLYLYFGAAPALLLFWPWAALTGHFLFHWQAVVLFCLAGFLTSLALLRSIWRRYFPEAGLTAAAGGALALGLATGVPILLQRAEIWEVPIACGYALAMLALGAIWLALQDSPARGWWLAAASAALGLAVGARPVLLPGALILLIPVVRSRQPLLPRLLCALGPIAIIGAGLALYNQLRFGHPFEFGHRYQLAGARQDTDLLFSPHYLWFNFRVYFLEPMGWSRHFPFVGPMIPPAVPPGHTLPEDPFGVLTGLPVLWLAGAAPLAWRDRLPLARGILRAFILAIALSFAGTALVLCLFYGNCSRYEVEFLPALVLLAVIGILGGERALLGQPGWRALFRTAWMLLLAFSIGFTLLTATEHYAEHRLWLGNQAAAAGQTAEAIADYDAALHASPALGGADNALANALLQAGRRTDAIAHYEKALQLDPGSAPAHYNLAIALLTPGRLPEAIQHFQAALRLAPADPRSHYALANALQAAGQPAEAIAQYEEATRLNPDYAEAQYNLGNALAQAGRPYEAATHYRAVLRLLPGNAAAHYNLGNALRQLGLEDEAGEQYRQARQLNPGLGRDAR